MKRREPRLLHIGAWWAWALLVAGAAGRTTNVLLLALLLAATHLVVVQRAGDTPWRRSYPAAVRLGVVIVVLRVALEVLFGVTPGATVVVSLPEVPLPDWAQGVRIGGAVTVEGLAAAFADGVRLATIVVVVGGAVPSVEPADVAGPGRAPATSAFARAASETAGRDGAGDCVARGTTSSSATTTAHSLRG